MAATKITCPECGKVLRPAKPLPVGQRVKCPKCSALFETRDEESTSETPALKASATTGAASGDDGEITPKPKAKKKAKKKTADEQPAKKKAAPDPDDDEGGPATYSFVDEHNKSDEPEIDYVPDTSIKDLRGPAQAAVIKPSNFMLMSGVLGAICYLAFIFIIMIPIVFPVPKYTPADGGAPVVEKKDDDKKEATGSMFMILTWDLMKVSDDWAWWEITLMMAGCVLGLVFCGIAIYGGVQMQTLHSRVWGIVASVMTMLPFLSTGTFLILCIIFSFAFQIILDQEDMIWVLPLWILLGYGPNLGFGIWGLITLLRPEVIEGYEFVPD